MRHLRVATALIILTAGAWPSLPQVVDDLYISYAYALALLEQGALVWDTGERVEGYSNFLWVLALAVGRSLGVPITWWAKGLSFGCAAWLVVDVHRRAPHNHAGAFLVLAIAGWSGLATWAGLGMETTAFALALWIGWGRAASGRPDGGLGALFVATLLHPEGIAYLIVAAVLTRGRISRAGQAAIGLAIAYQVWRVAYFGAVIPMPITAKLHASDLLSAGFLQAGPELLIALVPWAAALTAFRVERRFLLLVLGPPALHLAMLLRMHGDWMGDTRILLPGLLAGISVVVRCGTPRPLPPRWPLLAAPLLLLAPVRGQGFVLRPPLVARSLSALPRIVRTPLLEDVTFAIHRIPAAARFETGDIGLAGLVPGFRVVDAVGLTDAARARSRPGEDSPVVDARYRGEDALACVRRYPSDREIMTPRFQALVAPYRIEVAALPGRGGHRWWCLPDAPPADSATARERWLGLLDRLPEHPAIRWRAARALADQGDMTGAAELYLRDPLVGTDVDVALLFTETPTPEIFGPQGFRINSGDEISTRPLEASLPLHVLVQGTKRTKASWSWHTPDGAAGPASTESGALRIPLIPPVPGSRLVIRLPGGPSNPPAWVRAERTRE